MLSPRFMLATSLVSILAIPAMAEDLRIGWQQIVEPARYA